MKFISLLLVALFLVACESSEEKALKEFVSSQYKDPQSTQFQKVTFKNGVMCGEVNSKNGFGAYAGFKRFVAREVGSSGMESTIEGVGIFGNPLFSSAKIAISMSVENLLLAQRLNLLRAERKAEPIYKDTSPELAQYSDLLEIYKTKITLEIKDQEISKLAQEAADTIAFEEAFKASCSPS